MQELDCKDQHETRCYQCKYQYCIPVRKYMLLRKAKVNTATTLLALNIKIHHLDNEGDIALQHVGGGLGPRLVKELRREGKILLEGHAGGHQCHSYNPMHLTGTHLERERVTQATHPHLGLWAASISLIYGRDTSKN
mmetsp:Transcript_43685/g.68402  ORF Transcript_43685/g.68402 Transcript_43685/m.68402 type:complete len:137 (+) Transcript_43685:626-1036(+)